MNKCYLKEFQYFDSEEFITFNIYFLDKENNKPKLSNLIILAQFFEASIDFLADIEN